LASCISCQKNKVSPVIEILYPAFPDNAGQNVLYIFLDKKDAIAIDTIKTKAGIDQNSTLFIEMDYVFRGYMTSRQCDYDYLTFIVIPENTSYRDTISDIVVEEAPGTERVGNIVTSFKLNGVHLFGNKAHSTGRSY
jgi:hypothetical protein